VATEWFYSIDGEQVGPVSSSELKQLAASGEITPNDLVWREGMPEWTPARKVKGLFANAPPPPPQNRPTTVSGRHKQRLGILIAAGLGISATFLPWVHAPIIGSVAGTAGDGWITLVLFLPALIIALRGDSQTAIRGGKRLGLTIPAVLAAMLGIWKIVDFQQLKSDTPDDNPIAKAISASVQIGFGLYLLVAAGIAVAVVAWVLDKGRESQMVERWTWASSLGRHGQLAYCGVLLACLAVGWAVASLLLSR
jgi:hypothetical protein